jgi:hypothetical protein
LYCALQHLFGLFLLLLACWWCVVHRAPHSCSYVILYFHSSPIPFFLSDCGSDGRPVSLQQSVEYDRIWQ